jgi:ABA DEFICIENT 4-like
MDAELVFSICNGLVIPGWLLLAILPRSKWATTLIAPVIIPGALAVVYLILIVTNFGSGEGDFMSLAGVGSLFANPWILTAGWIHYLVFDLFIGSWEVRDSQRLGIRHAYVLPCLLFTFLFGPIGLLIYLVLRTFLHGPALES